MDPHPHQNNPLVAVGFLGSLGSGMLAAVSATPSVSPGAGSMIPFCGIVASVVMPVLVEQIRAGKALTIANERVASLQRQIEEMRSAASLQRQVDEMRIAATAATVAAASSSLAHAAPISTPTQTHEKPTGQTA